MKAIKHAYEVRPREPSAVTNALGYAKFYSCSHDAVIRVYDKTGNVIETHEHTGDFKAVTLYRKSARIVLIARTTCS